MHWPSSHIRKKAFWLLLACMGFQILYAQQTAQADTVFFLAHKKGLLGKIGRGLSVNNTDPLLPAEGAVKNEAPFNPYRGKIIRQILVQKIGFEL